METKRFIVTLTVEVEAYEEDMQDILDDYFGVGEEGPINIIEVKIK